jgi:hypothetical protein
LKRNATIYRLTHADFHGYTAAWAVKRNRPAAHRLEIDRLTPAAAPVAVADIFADVGGPPEARLRAAQATLRHLAGGPDRADSLAAAAVAAVTDRAADTHDYKLLAAALEDHARISPRWRDLYLAACTARFRGTGEPRNDLADRVDALLRSA